MGPRPAGAGPARPTSWWARWGYLWDIAQAAMKVQAFTAGRALEDYRGDAFLRSALEKLLGEP